MRNLLLFLLVLVGVYYLRRLFAGDKSDQNATSADAATRAEKSPPEIEQVLPCAQCGLLVPASEGVEAGGHFFCSQEHKKLGSSAS